MKIKYAAHLVMAVRFREGAQDQFPCYENVVLVYADNDDEAMAKAKRLGEDEAKLDDPSFTWDERPARWEFVGVRKLIECRSPGHLDERLGHGTEVTYSQYTVTSEEDLHRLAEGEPVRLLYEE